MSSNPSTPTPRYMGGQAVMEGVMMRGEHSWAVAVRTPEGDIEIEAHEAPHWAEKWSKVPLVRGVVALAESMSLGFKALAWSANRQIPEEEQISSKAMGWTIGAAAGQSRSGARRDHAARSPPAKAARSPGRCTMTS